MPSWHHDKQRPDLLRAAMASVAQVGIVALALGIAIGMDTPHIAAALVVALVCTVAVSAYQLHLASNSLEDAASLMDAEQAPEPDAPETKPAQKSLPAALPEAASIPSEPVVESSAAPVAASVPHSMLDLPALSRRIVGVAEPLTELKLFVGDIRTREALGKDAPDFPSPFECFAADMLAMAGLFENDVELPELRVVRPAASDMFYLRIQAREISYLAFLRVLAIEAALNALRFSASYFEDPDARSVEEHYQLQQKLTRSVAAQSPNLSEQVPVLEEPLPDGEWAVRLGISTAIESFQLPYRLTADWRVNVADGNVGIEIALTPEGAFPQTRYLDRLGLVPTTRSMRRQAASDYALRLAVLVAAAAFRCSERIYHVWVAGIERTPTRKTCLLSVDFDRWRFARLDLSELGDLGELYHGFAATIRLEEDILRPVEQTFSLSDPRFCPPRRFEPVGISTRRVAPPLADALGTDRVNGLSIDEASNRELAAADIVRGLEGSTSDVVRHILEVTADDADPTVRSAAERTVRKLIDGSIDLDPNSIAEEFLTGDALTKAVVRAQELLQKQDAPGAERVLATILGSIDAAGTYEDAPMLEHRFFANYVERALYNRLYALEGSSQLLVPSTYYHAHLLLSIAQAVQGKVAQALTHARRLVELAPLDARGYVHLSHCLEALGDTEGAIETINRLLSVAHDPQGLALAYYRMAYFQWQEQHALAAQACYALTLRYMPALAPVVAMEMGTLALQNPGAFREDMTEDEAREALRSSGVLVAPTPEIAEATMGCARAALDAEIFPVARNFAWVVGMLSGDDIMYGLLRSIEEGPET